jgi:hypothetical protein
VAYCCGSTGCSEWGCDICRAEFPAMNVTPFHSDASIDGFVGYNGADGSIVVSFAGTDPKEFDNW